MKSALKAVIVILETDTEWYIHFKPLWLPTRESTSFSMSLMQGGLAH